MFGAIEVHANIEISNQYIVTKSTIYSLFSNTN